MRDGSCDGATSTVARVGRRFVERVDVSYTVYVCEGERVRAGVMRVRSRGEFLGRGYSHTVGKCAPRVQQTEAWCHLQRRSPRATCRSANGIRPLLVVVDGAKAALSVNHGVRSHCERAPRESEHLRHMVLRRAPTRNPRPRLLE